jgi:hypothetical protein
MKTPSQKFLVYGLFLSVLAYFAGCGTGQYEDKLNRWVAGQESRATEKLGAPVAVPGTSIKIRLPTMPYAFVPLEGSADPRRLKPGGLSFPGWKATYEAQINAGGWKIPYYLYVGTLPLAENDRIQREILNDLEGKLKDTTAWTTLTADKPEGGFIDWTRVRGTATMDFVLVDPQKQEKPQSMKGTYEILYRRSGNQILLLGWRVPINSEHPEQYMKSAKVDTWLSPVAGAVTDGE